MSFFSTLSNDCFSPTTNYPSTVRILDRTKSLSVGSNLEAKMVDNQKKRKLPAALSGASAKNNGKRRKASGNQKVAAKPKRVVEASSLAWKSVDLPEMFNDAEGFFGLEEVTGVEVVRNGNTVKFVSETSPFPSHPAPSENHWLTYICTGLCCGRPETERRRRWRRRLRRFR